MHNTLTQLTREGLILLYVSSCKGCVDLFILSTVVKVAFDLMGGGFFERFVPDVHILDA